MAKANEEIFNTRVRTKLRGSYSHHYRRGLPKPLRAVKFRSNNDTFKPVTALRLTSIALEVSDSAS
ncbi:hypothetical protein [Nonomuraea sp. NPDC005692]|uniref:hypothetical protein n=1 Tax=Nonomuraea sp. NPDC005692 TaxID=3157168 RepID=UPI0033D8CBF8